MTNNIMINTVKVLSESNNLQNFSEKEVFEMVSLELVKNQLLNETGEIENVKNSITAETVNEFYEFMGYGKFDLNLPTQRFTLDDKVEYFHNLIAKDTQDALRHAGVAVEKGSEVAAMAKNAQGSAAELNDSLINAQMLLDTKSTVATGILEPSSFSFLTYAIGFAVIGLIIYLMKSMRDISKRRKELDDKMAQVSLELQKVSAQQTSKEVVEKEVEKEVKEEVKEENEQTENEDSETPKKERETDNE